MPYQVPATTFVRCQSCQKPLKYTGKKLHITCPVCGSIVTTNVRKSPSIEVDGLALSSNANGKGKTLLVVGMAFCLFLFCCFVWWISSPAVLVDESSVQTPPNSKSELSLRASPSDDLTDLYAERTARYKQQLLEWNRLTDSNAGIDAERANVEFRIQSLEREKPLSPPENRGRLWTSKDNKFTTFGLLVDTNYHFATIRKEDGKTIRVPKTRLIDSDRAYIESNFDDASAYEKRLMTWNANMQSLVDERLSIELRLSAVNKPKPMLPTKSEFVKELESARAKGIEQLQIAKALEERKAFETKVRANEITNSIGMKLVLIQAGSFTMGAPMEEAERQESEVPHQVTINDSYFLGVYEVTQGQYEKVMGNNPSGFKGINNPVEKTNWDDAVSFCKKLSELPEEKVSKREYRLPTEEEWEYACRAGSSTSISFGATAKSLESYAWFAENSERKTHPVGMKMPNAWGLYDMHGNVWERCQDLYADYPSAVATGPVGPERVNRGGSWAYPAVYCRAAGRAGWDATSRTNDCGFRIALNLPSKQPESAVSK